VVEVPAAKAGQVEAADAAGEPFLHQPGGDRGAQVGLAQPGVARVGAVLPDGARQVAPGDRLGGALDLVLDRARPQQPPGRAQQLPALVAHPGPLQKERHPARVV